MAHVNLDDLEPGTPEFEAAVASAQAEEDAATGNVEDKSEGEETSEEGESEGKPAEGESDDKPGADDKPAEGDGDAATEASTEDRPKDGAGGTEAEPPKAEGETGKAGPEGVLSKDGKRVLPYVVLKGARDETRSEREKRVAVEAENAELKRKLEAITNGEPADADEKPTDEELQDVAKYAPKVAKTLDETTKRAEELERENTELRSKVPAAEVPVVDVKAQVEEAIDSVPTLAEWRATRDPKWARAVEVDKVLQGSPKWKGKPLEARFTEATRMVCDEYDIEFGEHEPPPQQEAGSKRQAATQPSKAKADPKKAVESAPRQQPNTLSDFKGGSVEHTDERLERLPAIKQLARVEDLDDDEFNRYLAKLA